LKDVHSLDSQAGGIETSPNNWLWQTGSLCCPEKQISRVFVTFQELFATTIITGETSFFKSLAKHRTQTRTKPNLSCNFSSLFFRSIVYLEQCLFLTCFLAGILASMCSLNFRSTNWKVCHFQIRMKISLRYFSIDILYRHFRPIFSFIRMASYTSDYRILLRLVVYKNICKLS